MSGRPATQWRVTITPRETAHPTRLLSARSPPFHPCSILPVYCRPFPSRNHRPRSLPFSPPAATRMLVVTAVARYIRGYYRVYLRLLMVRAMLLTHPLYTAAFH
eukprot:486288-Pleurochrysis_carterae.AAC.1